MKDLQIQDTQSIGEIKDGIQSLQKVMKEVMKEDIHYGVVPGCGKKPALLKPGAEKIMATFRIAPIFDIEDLSTEDEARFRVITKGTYSPTGNFLGQGVGECSSNEEKFKWRASVCNEEFEATPEARRRIKWKKGWNGPATSIKQVRDSHTDKANTVLKMAKKRSCIDMVLTVTAASDIFAQDIDENHVPEVKQKIEMPTKVEPVKKVVIENVEEPQKDEKKSEGSELICNECNVAVTENISKFSKKEFSRALCFDCQKVARTK